MPETLSSYLGSRSNCGCSTFVWFNPVCSCVWESGGRWPKYMWPLHPSRRWDKVPGTWLHCDPALAITAIWGVKTVNGKKKKNISFSFPLCSSLCLSNSFFKVWGLAVQLRNNCGTEAPHKQETRAELSFSQSASAKRKENSVIFISGQTWILTSVPSAQQ